MQLYTGIMSCVLNYYCYILSCMDIYNLEGKEGYIWLAADIKRLYGGY